MRTILHTAVVAILLSFYPLRIHSQSVQDTMRVDKSTNGYVIHFRDEAYDNEWRRYDLPAANRLQVSVSSAVRRQSSGDWRYEYSLANRVTSDQSVAAWGFQAAGSETFEGPAGWQIARSGPGKSVIHWFGTTAAISPGKSQGTWMITSDRLPEIRRGYARGSIPTDAASLDIPGFVRDRITELERHNVAEVVLIAPWTPTQRLVRGVVEKVALNYILSQTLTSFVPGLGSSLDVPSGGVACNDQARQRVGRALQHIGTANAALARGDTAEALRTLVTSKQLLQDVAGERCWLAEIESALAVVVDFVLGELR